MPDSKRENYFAFLDALRESGRINMFGAAPFLRDAFPELSGEQAKAVLMSWMEERTRNGTC